MSKGQDLPCISHKQSSLVCSARNETQRTHPAGLLGKRESQPDLEIHFRTFLLLGWVGQLSMGRKIAHLECGSVPMLAGITQHVRQIFFFFLNGQDLSGFYSFFKSRVNMIVKFYTFTSV